MLFSTRDPAHARVALSDAVIASAAAPLYFPAHRVAALGREFVDGGLYANAPDLAALAELRRMWPRLELERVSLVSVGATPAPAEPRGSDPSRGVWGHAIGRTWIHSRRDGA